MYWNIEEGTIGWNELTAFIVIPTIIKGIPLIASWVFCTLTYTSAGRGLCHKQEMITTLLSATIP